MGLPHWLVKPDPTIYLTGNYVVVDLETTNKDKGNACNKDNRMVLARWFRSDNRVSKCVVGTEYDVAELIADLEWADFFVAQNAKFELKWLSRAGADLTKLLPYDTMIGEYVIAGNRKWALDLGSISQRYGYGGKDPFVDICMKGGVCPSDMPTGLLSQRCGKDIYQTEKIFLAQRDRLAQDGLLACFFTRCIFSPVLADIEMQGMHLSDERVSLEYKRVSEEFRQREAEIDEFTGGVNPRSPKQVQEYLYDTLKFKPLRVRGKATYGTDSDTIAALKATTKKQKAFVELKKEFGKLNAMKTKNLDFFYGVCKEHGGVFYAQFNQCITKTHRLSSSGIATKFDMFDKPKSVQFQNMPRQYKGLFCPRNDGWLMGEIDGAQLEFRVAAFLGQDEQAITDIQGGVDVHQFTADTITSAGQTLTRQEAKSRTFKPLYFGSSGTDAERTYYNAFKTKYSGISSAQQAWLDEVVRTKSLRLTTGLKAYWPTTTVQSSGYITNSTQICNLPVQNLATAEMVPIAVTYQWHRMKGANMQSFLVNTIHDSSVGEIHPDETELYSRIGVQSFTDDTYFYLKEVYGLDWNVPMGAGVKIGEYWGEGEECVYTR